jgi:hypothetical protein
MNGRITDETTPARRISALAFSVVLRKFEEFRRANPERMNDFLHVEEYLDYGDFIEYMDICLKKEFILTRIDELKHSRGDARMVELDLQLYEAIGRITELDF